MIKVDEQLQFCELDLNETASMFDGGENLNIRHRFKESENKIVNTITINGETYAYGNLTHGYKDEIDRKRKIKRYAKLSLYKAISKVLNVELPWGALTGIRPTKLAYSEIEESGDFKDFFIDTMKVSEKKTLLVEKVINAQKGIYKKDNDSTDFFVFIPFCPSRCNYCSFITADINTARKHVVQYVDSLIKEIEESKKLIKNLSSIYIGGGTPVSLPIEQLERVLKAIDSINTGVEYTVEAGRPDVIDEEKLQLLKKYRVTRICINPQSFKQKTLDIIGRKHTVQDIIDKYNLAKDRFSINMDLIAGLTEETFEDFKNSVDRAISLSPDGITIHTLSIKHGSYLAENTNRLCLQDIEKMVDYAHSALEEAGYIPYYLYRQKYMAGNLENTGYCKKNKQCGYNIRVMEEVSNNIACGAGAVSKKVNLVEERIERYGNPKDVLTYIQKIDLINKEKRELFN